MRFAADEARPATPGEVTLYVNGEQVGSGRMDHTVALGFSGYSGLDVGQDNGLVVDRSYAGKAPFTFTGTVKKVVFDVAPHLDSKDEIALHQHAQQAHGPRHQCLARPGRLRGESDERHRLRRRHRGLPHP